MQSMQALAEILCQSESSKQALFRLQHQFPNRPQRWLLQLLHTQAISLIQFQCWLSQNKYPQMLKLSPYNGPLPGRLQLSHLLDHQVIITSHYAGVLQIGLLDPLDQNIIEQFQMLSQQEIEWVILDPQWLASQLQQLKRAIHHPSTPEPSPSGQSSLSEQITQLISRAWMENVSDLHFEPTLTDFRIRARIDGLLHPYMTYPKQLAPNIISWLKVASQLDIAQKRLPQDGRLKLESGPAQDVDIRISTLPTIHGEKIALRLLGTNQQAPSLEQLGLNQHQLQQLIHALEQPQGMIIVTGPTGSGKTSTLYAALARINHPSVNISTAEDPVEINLSGINQVPINPTAGLTFAKLLRAFLRQDPDIIMVGEIRDPETAEIAFRAAQTGHRVLTTLHTNNAIETITRLEQLGIPRYQISESTRLIIAQRLVRKICPICHGVDPTTSAHDPCHFCHQGYQGRIGIFELLESSATVAQLILEKASPSQWLSQLDSLHYSDLWANARELVELGITSDEEIQRVLGNNRHD
ncbi:GspE/PulE family protein [Celerinatantimonas sp. YJH-8]|uniref:GspE/PulE family protein n=1 Tax=Celerinatantimonas sp. YJH-8 TaxID=3228714 RepID=UPI0038C67E76